MPSFVNIGAYVGEGTMVDTWTTVGSCAQIGKHCHLSGGVGIGGVLEPLQANPVIIEDNCFIGARSEVAEGVIVREGSVVGMGVYLGQSTPIVNRATGETLFGEVPPYSVVVAGNRPGSTPMPGQNWTPSLYCAVIVKQVDAGTRSKTSSTNSCGPKAAPPRNSLRSSSITEHNQFQGSRQMGIVYLILFALAAIFAISLIVGAVFKLIGFAIAALLVVVAVTWVMRKLRGPKSPERLSALRHSLQHTHNARNSVMPSFVLYLLGFVILSGGILFAASILGVSNQWIAVIGLVLLGLGVITGVAKTRRRDAPAASEPSSEYA